MLNCKLDDSFKKISYIIDSKILVPCGKLSLNPIKNVNCYFYE